MGSVLAADFDHVSETGGGQQSGTRAAALQQGVGGNGCPVYELGVNRCLTRSGSDDSQVGKSRQNGLALVGGRCGLFMHLQLAVLQEHKVSESSANIDSNQSRRHCGLS